MILNAENAFKEYFEDHMVDLIGNGNYEIGIYEHLIPDDAAGDVLVCQLETPAPSQHRGNYLVRMRFVARANKKSNGFALIQNMDLLIDRRAVADLTSDIEMCTCLRIAGPDYITERSMHFYTCLYDVQLRKTDL